MKRLKAFICALALLAAFAAGGCEPAKETTSRSAAEQAVADFLDALKNGDFDKADTLIASDGETVFFFGMDDRQFDLYRTVSLSTDSISLLFRYCASLIEYDFTFCEIKDHSAQVRCYVKLFDGEDFLPSVYSGLYQAFLAAGLNDTDYPDTKTYVDSRIVQEISQTPPDKREMIASFELTKTDGRWLIKSTSDVCTVMTAGLFDKPELIESALEKVGMGTD